MERQKQSVTNRSVENATGGSRTASRRAAGAPENAAATTPPRDTGHYVCACESGPGAFDIPQELQLFTADRQNRDMLWSGTVAEAAAPGLRRLSPNLAERPPPVDRSPHFE